MKKQRKHSRRPLNRQPVISEEVKTIVFLLALLILIMVVVIRVFSSPLEARDSTFTINPPVEVSPLDVLSERQAPSCEELASADVPDDPELFRRRASQTTAPQIPPSTLTPILEPSPLPTPILTAAKIEPICPTMKPESDDTQSIAVEPLDEICGFYRPDVPMSREHQMALFTICNEVGVDINLAFGLIQLESTFDPYAVSETGCYGYCQLSRYFPSGLSPEDNMRAGIGWLGDLIEQYGDVEKALTVYHLGSDDGTRTYAGVVLGYARAWGYEG